jgi:hypothetical protein
VSLNEEDIGVAVDPTPSRIARSLCGTDGLPRSMRRHAEAAGVRGSTHAEFGDLRSKPTHQPQETTYGQSEGRDYHRQHS